ncbi:penicillin-binding protein 1A [Marinomonas mediterranea]|jgi:penicillin-binding protein, 1A family|uniref:Penicillin-binding protein 1A n=1 Tax=Marinomonas mediterranea (strain ATCC 700492 / JCM 21426 / NBRC 103028 / MMB-1) TaxID=717774 RepID=F2JW45_MARM1|nr:penicillin-binding protein 1A [Marinomonas mediterranea]ADZ92933.1 penicillin-binding protein, 1A family [Marinomonas mediterranea MMB-1]WCN10855.1 PBP1A family penicillin-binding protein [Marinomonas mediterranea]WCN14912.1 PBP1A family penicillin-binding protein [Marinomonas mediterranea]WCN18956.1 PBP1A family penicillin-binding protein [Marinomonas mediterranea MMB-1]
MSKFIKIVLALGLVGTLAGVGIAVGMYYQVKDKIPTVAELKDIELQIPLRIYTADEKLIGEYGEQRRTPINFDQIPKELESAILAAEDTNFYHHPGIDIMGMGRAAFQLVSSGRIRGGGSTITMQVARNYFLSFEQTFTRKFTEILISLKMEQELSKQEILELYVNKIYLGKRAYGFEAAAQVYYGKPLAELSLAQIAMIAGLPKAPSLYNPIVNPSRALIRRNWILQRMLSLGMIDKQSYQEAVEATISAKNHGVSPDIEASYVSEMVRSELYETFGKDLYNEGLKVYTTIISDRQEAANKAIYNGVLSYDERHGYRGPLESRPDLVAADLKEQTKELKKISNVKGWQTAIVINTEEQGLDARLESGKQVALTWDALKWAKPYIDENKTGPEPKTVADIVVAGDVIQLRPVEITDKETGETQQSWRLAQTPAAQSALVSLDSRNGAIQSLVGGFDYYQNKFNRVTQSKRQPGSNFKPFVYSSALSRGYTAASIINDAPVVFHDKNLATAWRPTNDGGKFYGPTRLRQALYRSQNVVSVRLLDEMGIKPTLEFLKRFGFDSEKLPHNLSLSLGSANLSPLQIATGYAVFSNGGFRVQPFLIDRVEDRNGKVLFQSEPMTVCKQCTLLDKASEEDAQMGLFNVNGSFATLPVAPRVLDPDVTYIIYDIMRDVIKYGTGRRARVLKRDDIAGKTGTTNDGRDAWFSGFNGHIVTSVWSGFDNSSPLGRVEWGGSVSLPSWISYMRHVLTEEPKSYIDKPSSLITVRIDPKTGERALPGQKNAIFEVFRQANVPAKRIVAVQKTETQSTVSETQQEKKTESALENLF